MSMFRVTDIFTLFIVNRSNICFIVALTDGCILKKFFLCRTYTHIIPFYKKEKLYAQENFKMRNLLKFLIMYFTSYIFTK